MRELIRIVQSHMDEYGVSEAEIARRIGTTPQTVNSWRNGEMKQLPRQRYLQALAELTKTDYAAVLSAALIDTNYIQTPLQHKNDYVSMIIELAVDVDSLESAVADMSTDIDVSDPDEVASLISAAEDLQREADDAVIAVNNAALRAVGGDALRLRQVKREMLRYRRARTRQSGAKTSERSSLDESESGLADRYGGWRDRVEPEVEDSDEGAQ